MAGQQIDHADNNDFIVYIQILHLIRNQEIVNLNWRCTELL